MTTKPREKPKGWHSRAHQTSEAQDAARARYIHRADERPKQRWNFDTKTWEKVT